MCVRSNSANIVQAFTIDTGKVVNSVFKRHHVAEQMSTQHQTHQCGLPPLPSFTPPLSFPCTSALFPPISPALSCLCFGCRSEVNSVCWIHFQFPFCGGIPPMIMLPFPTLALCAQTEQPKNIRTQRPGTLTDTVRRVFVVVPS